MAHRDQHTSTQLNRTLLTRDPVKRAAVQTVNFFHRKLHTRRHMLHLGVPLAETVCCS